MNKKEQIYRAVILAARTASMLLIFLSLLIVTIDGMSFFNRFPLLNKASLVAFYIYLLFIICPVERLSFMSFNIVVVPGGVLMVSGAIPHALLLYGGVVHSTVVIAFIKYSLAWLLLILIYAYIPIVICLRKTTLSNIKSVDTEAIVSHKKSLLTKIIVVIIVVFAIGTLFCLPVLHAKEYSKGRNKGKELLQTLRNRRPAHTSVDTWDCAIGWTRVAYGNVFAFHEYVSYEDMLRFNTDLSRKLDEKVNLKTIDWFWERLAETGKNGKGYVSNFEPQYRRMINEIEKAQSRKDLIKEQKNHNEVASPNSDSAVAKPE